MVDLFQGRSVDGFSLVKYNCDRLEKKDNGQRGFGEINQCMYMQKNRLTVLSIFVVVTTAGVSCRNVVNLNDSAKNFVIYKGSERLIYSSSSNNTDTILLLGYQNYFTTEKPKNGFGKFFIEHYDLIASSNYIKTSGFKNVAAESFLIGVAARESKKVVISFNLVNPSKGYYFWNSFYFDSLSTFSDKDSLRLGGEFGKLFMFKNLSKANYITPKNIDRIFWSDSIGIVGYVLFSGEMFKLRSI